MSGRIVAVEISTGNGVPSRAGVCVVGDQAIDGEIYARDCVLVWALDSVDGVRTVGTVGDRLFRLREK